MGSLASSLNTPLTAYKMDGGLVLKYLFFIFFASIFRIFSKIFGVWLGIKNAACSRYIYFYTLAPLVGSNYYLMFLILFNYFEYTLKYHPDGIYNIHYTFK